MLNHIKIVAKLGFYSRAPLFFKYSRAALSQRAGMFGTLVPRFHFAGTSALN